MRAGKGPCSITADVQLFGAKCVNVSSPFPPLSSFINIWANQDAPQKWSRTTLILTNAHNVNVVVVCSDAHVGSSSVEVKKAGFKAKLNFVVAEEGDNLPARAAITISCGALVKVPSRELSSSLRR